MLRHATVAFGFPDTLFQADDAFVQLPSHQASSDADVIMGLFPGDKEEKFDMIDLYQAGKVRQIKINPTQTVLRHTLPIAVWTPVFTEFLHGYVAALKSSAKTNPELTIGAVFRAAIQDGLRFEGVQFSAEPYLDIGTPANLVRAAVRYTVQGCFVD